LGGVFACGPAVTASPIQGEQRLWAKLLRTQDGIKPFRNPVSTEDRSDLLPSGPEEITDEISEGLGILDAMITVWNDRHHCTGDLGLRPEAAG
jgi:hypothetical protein